MFEVVIVTDYSKDPAVLKFDNVAAATTCFEWVVEHVENIENASLEFKKGE